MSVNARELDRLADRHGVEPAAAPRPPGIRPELLAALAHAQTGLIGELRRERPAADSRRVGLGHSQNEAVFASRKTRADRGLSGHGVRRSDVRTGPVVNVEHRSLGSFENEALAGLIHIVKDAPDRRGVGQNLGRDFPERSESLLEVGFRGPQPTPQGVVVREKRNEAIAQVGGIGQVRDADGPAGHLVFIGRTDSPSGRSDPVLTGKFFAEPVKLGVNRKIQRGVLGDDEVLRSDLETRLPQLIYFGDEREEIRDHAVPERGQNATHDSRGDEPHLERPAVVVHHRMAGVVAALETDDRVVEESEKINHPSLGLVSPLNSNHNHVLSHFSLLLLFPFASFRQPKENLSQTQKNVNTKTAGRRF